MAQRKTIKSRIIDHAESIIPTEFYDVREETHPKAGWFPMFGLTAIVYVAATIAFILLFVNEQTNTSVETIITSYDYDGADGYTCQMISYASATVTITSANDPSMQYNLVDVMESKTQCQNNFIEASPCTSEPLTFFPGSAAVKVPYQEGFNYGAVALFGDDSSFYWMTYTSLNGNIVPYNSSSGQMNEHVYTMPYAAMQSINSLALDRDSNPIYVSRNFIENDDPPKSIFRSYPDSGVVEVLYTTDQYLSPTVLNDNLYNVYMFLNNTFSLIDVYASPVTNTTLFALDAEENIYTAAVYHDGVTPTVHYISSASYSDTNDDILLFTYRDGVTSSSKWQGGGNEIVRLAVDGMNRVYGLVLVLYLMNEGSGDYIVTTSTSVAGVYSLVGSIDRPPTGFGINPSGNRIMVTSQTELGAAQWGYIYPLSTDALARNKYNIVMQQTGFSGGWYMCEDKVLPSSQYTPGAVAEYPQFCETNGIVGQIVYNSQYLFNAVDLQTFATTNALHYCPNLYAPITAKISKLPPYSCSRTLHQSFLSCFGTAFANMTFLMQLLVFAFAMWLPKLAERYPVQEESAERKSASHRKSVNKDSDRKSTEEMEMTNMPQEVDNPIQKE